MLVNRTWATTLISLLAVAAFAPSASHAARAPDHDDSQSKLHVASGAEARPTRLTQWTLPRAASGPWSKFLRSTDGTWRAYFDATTKVPGRIFGSGISVEGGISSPAAAEQAARAFLAEHIDLVAPGSAAADFELASNVIHGDMRTLGFIQRHRGLEVIGGQVSFRIKNDRLFVIGSEALPRVTVEPAAREVSATRAKQIALDYVVKETGSQVSLRSADGAFILPIVRVDGTITYDEVVRVVVDARAPIGRWAVYLDRSTGTPIAREQLLFFQQAQTAEVKFNTPDRYPRSDRSDKVARDLNVTVDGAASRTTRDGLVNLVGEGASVTLGVVGPQVRVINEEGAAARLTESVTAGSEINWRSPDDEFEDAQLNGFIASTIVKDKAKQMDPNMSWLNEQLQATVNIGGNCNAFSDGETINFFTSSRQCENTGRLPDVVYHEFGHSFHAHAIIRGVGSFDGALSEGISDILAAFITEDPGMGRGFFYTDEALRHIDEPGRERKWPDDVGESHTTGIIIGGTFWDLRKGLIAVLGEDAGKSHTEALYMAVIRRASDIPSSYVEVLAADDDDGDLSNRTPNFCVITEAYAAHGLADPNAAGPGIQAPVLTTDLGISLPVTRGVECPGTGIGSVEVQWKLRDVAGTGGTFTLAEQPAAYEGAIPPQPAGSVVQYQVRIALENGDVFALPDNPADPFYETYIGQVEPLYCTDFETDPINNDGWAHTLVSGTQRDGADDWQWGAPAGTQGSGDPDAAFSGTRVIGNDLGGGNFNGLYQPNKVNEMVGPVIRTDGYEEVRLQYRRWLNVENGFFDKARIIANDQEVWANAVFGERDSTHHVDKEWRFHDVDLSNAIGGDTVQVKFQIESDGGLEFGGWTIDDFCIVGIGNQAAVCGDGVVGVGETCDDGNLIDADGCNSDCTPSSAAELCGNGALDAGEACDPGIDGTCNADCTPMTQTVDPNLMGGDDVKVLPEADSSCGCSATEPQRPSGPSAIALGLVVLGLALRRRRR